MQAKPSYPFRHLIETPPPDTVGIGIEQSADRIAVQVKGRGAYRGPAVLYVLLAVIAALFGATGLIKWLLHRDEETLWIGIWSWVATASLWGIGTWRGKWSTRFDIRGDGLTVTMKAPLFGCLSERKIPWERIRGVQVRWLGTGGGRSPLRNCLEIEEVSGALHRYLRDFPDEGAYWLEDVLSGAQKMRATATPSMTHDHGH